MPEKASGLLTMRIALSWRALSESASHLDVVERLQQDHGHTVLVLKEPGGESSGSWEGIVSYPVRSRGRWHPCLNVLTGWKEALEAFCPDIFLGLEEPYSLRSALFLRWTRQRSVPFVFLSCQNIDRLLPYPFRVLESWVLSQAQGAWFLNLDAAARARRRGFRGVGRVIPLGTQTGLVSLGRTGMDPGLDFTVGYAGRLVPEKGVDDLIRACALAGVRLLVVGEGPDQPRLQRLAEQLGVDVTWLGRVESTGMGEIYSRMDTLVLPSFTTPRWKEQFGRVLVEAMSCGVPVVGSDSGEIPQVIGQAGLIFPERECHQLAACLSRLRQEPSLRLDLSRRGQVRARDLFGWGQVTNLLNELILAVVCRDS